MKKQNKAVKMYNGNGVKSLKVVHWNMGSCHWIRKIAEIQILLMDTKPDITIISEANIFAENQDYEIHIPGYNLIQPKSMVSSGYSRLAVLVKEGVQVQTLEQYMDEEIASVWLKISSKGTKKIHLGAIYRQHKLIKQGTPNLSGDINLQVNRWKKFVSQWKAASNRVDTIVMGDINLDFNKLETPDYQHEEMTEILKNEIETLGFIQVIKRNTRSQAHHVDSLLDHCWTSNPQRILSSSDHNLIEVVIRIKGKPSKAVEILARSKKNLDVKRFGEKMAEIDWSGLYQINDIDIANSHYEAEVLRVLDVEIPMKISQVRSKHKVWISRDTRDLMTLRDNAKIKAQGTQLDNDWRTYRQLRNRCSSQCKNDKKKHFNKIYEDCDRDRDIKSLYNITKTQLGWKSGGPPSALVVDGKYLTAPKDIANTQNEFFVNKVEQLRQELPPTNEDPLHHLKAAMGKWAQADSRPIFSLKEVTQLEIVKIIKSMGNSTAFGHNKIDAMSVKMAATSLLAPLTYLTNLSIKNSVFASKWKIGRLVPLFKGKGLNETERLSYRPISLLSVTAKIVERVMQQQMLNYLEDTKQINQNNNAYRKHHSTISAIIEMTDAIFGAADQRLIATITTIDESCAFDCVVPDILLDKLGIYNFSESVIKWLSNYLSFRSQYVTIGSKSSSMKWVKSGVPQGSVMGPLLYTMYINELPNITKNEDTCNIPHHMNSNLFGNNCLNCGTVPAYADDATIIAASPSRDTNQLKMIDNMEIMKKFLANNKLSMNATKTKIVESMVKQRRWRTRGTGPSLETTNNRGEKKTITTDRYTRILGCNIPDNLNWQAHLATGEKALIKETRKKLGAIKHLGNQLPRRCKQILANGLIQSKASYLIAVGGGGGGGGHNWKPPQKDSSHNKQYC